jgi:hypothetical protein
MPESNSNPLSRAMLAARLPPGKRMFCRLSVHHGTRTGNPISMNPANFKRMWIQLGGTIRELHRKQLDNNVLRMENKRLNNKVSEVEVKFERCREKNREQQKFLEAAEARSSANEQILKNRTDLLRQDLSSARNSLLSSECARRVSEERWQEAVYANQDMAETICDRDRTIQNLKVIAEEQARTIAAQGVMIEQHAGAASDKQENIDAWKLLYNSLKPASSRTAKLEEALKNLFKLNEQLLISMSDPITMDLPEGDVHMLPCGCGSMYSVSTLLRIISSDPARAPVMTAAQRRNHQTPVRPPGSHQCPAKCPVCKAAFTTDHFTRRVPSFSSACEIIRETDAIIKKAMCSNN